MTATHILAVLVIATVLLGALLVIVTTIAIGREKIAAALAHRSTEDADKPGGYTAPHRWRRVHINGDRAPIMHRSNVR